MEAVASWDMVGKRWIRCGVLNAMAAALLWLAWELLIARGSWLGTVLRFLSFELAQVLFLVGQKMVVSPEEPSPLSIWNMLLATVSLAWHMLFSSKDTPTDTTTSQASIITQKALATRDVLIFTMFLVTSGLTSMYTLASSSSHGDTSSLDMIIRGISLSVCFLAFYLRDKYYIVKFPIIQRREFFSFKMGLPWSFSTAARVTLAFIPAGVAAVHTVRLYTAGEWASFSLREEFGYAMAAFFTVLSWNICCQLIQVIHTGRHVFAPPQGSAEAETNPTGPLLAVLENDQNLIQHYLGYLDAYTLATVSEMNVEAWRRAAFFEESGEAYKKLIVACLRPIDRLTIRLVRGLETVQSDSLSFEMLAGGHVAEIVHAKQSFQDSKLCSWCIGIVSSLTAYSRTEDRYGVAQLSGCNGAVLSSLLSCLLIVEVYLGKRSSFQALSFVGPNGIKWAVPFRGAFMDSDRKQNVLFKKKSSVQKNAHAMADVLRTAIYGIVTVFKDEMVTSGSGSSVFSVAERDWLSRNKPLFGTPEVHLQKLTQFLEFRE